VPGKPGGGVVMSLDEIEPTGIIEVTKIPPYGMNGIEEVK
jgi:hypothetical protein